MKAQIWNESLSFNCRIEIVEFKNMCEFDWKLKKFHKHINSNKPWAKARTFKEFWNRWKAWMNSVESWQKFEIKDFAYKMYNCDSKTRFKWKQIYRWKFVKAQIWGESLSFNCRIEIAEFKSMCEFNWKFKKFRKCINSNKPQAKARTFKKEFRNHWKAWMKQKTLYEMYNCDSKTRFK